MVLKSINKQISGRIYHYDHLLLHQIIPYKTNILMSWNNMKLISLAYIFMNINCNVKNMGKKKNKEKLLPLKGIWCVM